MNEKAAAVRYGFWEKALLWFVANPVLIYTVGKVGSSSIAVSLRKNGIKEVQPHSLQFVRRGSYFVSPELNPVESLYYFGKTLLLKLKVKAFKLWCRLLSRKITIVSLFRDPVARNISAFFEQSQYVTDVNLASESVEGLPAIFWKHCNHKAPKVWFDQELKRTFGIDVLKHPFDKENGYSIIRTKHVDVLVLTMEKLNGNEAVIGQFLGIDNFSLVSTNRSENKAYKDVYRKFIKDLNIPRSYCDELYQSPIVRHFYSAAEVEAFYDRWMTSS